MDSSVGYPLQKPGEIFAGELTLHILHILPVHKQEIILMTRCILVLCDTFDTSISIVSTVVSIPV